jgi:hypothetical protein
VPMTRVETCVLLSEVSLASPKSATWKTEQELLQSDTAETFGGQDDQRLRASSGVSFDPSTIASKKLSRRMLADLMSR